SRNLFTAQILRLLDLRLYQQFAARHRYGVGDIDQVCAVQIRQHDLRQRHRRGEQAAAQQRLRTLARAAQKNDLDVEAVSLVNLRILGDPRNPHGRRQGSHTPIDLLQRPVLREALRVETEIVDEKPNYQNPLE